MKKVLLGVLMVICITVWGIFFIFLSTSRLEAHQVNLASGRLTVLKTMEMTPLKKELKEVQKRSEIGISSHKGHSQTVITRNLLADHSDKITMSINDLMSILKID